MFTLQEPERRVTGSVLLVLFFLLHKYIARCSSELESVMMMKCYLDISKIDELDDIPLPVLERDIRSDTMR